jgi:hypothetical protein
LWTRRTARVTMDVKANGQWRTASCIGFEVATPVAAVIVSDRSRRRY